MISHLPPPMLISGTEGPEVERARVLGDPVTWLVRKGLPGGLAHLRGTFLCPPPAVSGPHSPSVRPLSLR